MSQAESAEARELGRLTRTAVRGRSAPYPRTCGLRSARASLPPAMRRVRKADARRPDRGVQLPLPSGAEPAPPGGGGPRGAPEPSAQLEALVEKVDRLHVPRGARR